MLLDNLENVTRVVDFLIQWNIIDQLYYSLRPFLTASANYKQKAEKEATVGLAFRFAQTTPHGNGSGSRAAGVGCFILQKFLKFKAAF